jgi:hypothetical protein
MAVTKACFLPNQSLTWYDGYTFGDALFGDSHITLEERNIESETPITIYILNFSSIYLLNESVGNNDTYITLRTSTGSTIIPNVYVGHTWCYNAHTLVLPRAVMVRDVAYVNLAINPLTTDDPSPEGGGVCPPPPPGTP